MNSNQVEHYIAVEKSRGVSYSAGIMHKVKGNNLLSAIFGKPRDTFSRTGSTISKAGVGAPVGQDRHNASYAKNFALIATSIDSPNKVGSYAAQDGNILAMISFSGDNGRVPIIAEIQGADGTAFAVYTNRGH